MFFYLLCAAKNNLTCGPRSTWSSGPFIDRAKHIRQAHSINAIQQPIIPVTYRVLAQGFHHAVQGSVLGQLFLSFVLIHYTARTNSIFVWVVKIEQYARRTMEVQMGPRANYIQLPFVPSLGWWAARAMAQHKGKCDKCKLCEAIHAATPCAQERIDRALRGEDALEWIKVAVTHSSTDYSKAEAMMSWALNANWDFSLVNEPRGILKSERTEEFIFGGQHHCVLVRTYNKDYGGECHVVIGGETLGAFRFPISNWNVYKSPREPWNRTDINTYSYYKIGCTYKSNVAEITARVLRELISSGDLRVEWIPLRKAPPFDLFRKPVKVEYTQCEHGQWDNAEKKLIKI
jgi:hypothetical protein